MLLTNMKNPLYEQTYNGCAIYKKWGTRSRMLLVTESTQNNTSFLDNGSYINR